MLVKKPGRGDRAVLMTVIFCRQYVAQRALSVPSSHGAVGYSLSLVSKTGDLSGQTICGFAACYAGWLRLPGTRRKHPSSSSPCRRLSLRHGEEEGNGAVSARKGEALPQSGAAEPQRSAILDSSDFLAPLMRLGMGILAPMLQGRGPSTMIDFSHFVATVDMSRRGRREYV